LDVCRRPRRVARLEEASARLEQVHARLAKAHARLEERMGEPATQVDRLSGAVGFTLEELAWELARYAACMLQPTHRAAMGSPGTRCPSRRHCRPLATPGPSLRRRFGS
jgi:hypothetical protein